MNKFVVILLSVGMIASSAALARDCRDGNCTAKAVSRKQCIMCEKPLGKKHKGHKCNACLEEYPCAIPCNEAGHKLIAEQRAQREKNAPEGLEDDWHDFLN